MDNPQEIQPDDDGGDALVSEFPPPPYYYALAATTSTVIPPSPPSGPEIQAPSSSTTQPASFPVPEFGLAPPPIPHDALIRSTKKAVAHRRKVRMMEEEAEKQRFGEEEDAKLEEVNKTGMSIGELGAGLGAGAGAAASGIGIGDGKGIEQAGGALGAGTAGTNETEEDIENDNGPVVAVFGEDCYVEDPTLVPVEDGCDDPKKVKDKVSRLNKDILVGFITLLGDLVNQPLAHEKCRQQLLNNIEVMLKECNKFREHQARELLIETLEAQLHDRKSAVEELKGQLSTSDDLLTSSALKGIE